MILQSAALFGSAAARDALQLQAETFVARASTRMTRDRALVETERRHLTGFLTARRRSLGEHFGRYQRFKHDRIFDPVIEHGTASTRIVARTMKIDCMDLGETFGAYHARWLGLSKGEWHAYRLDMRITVDMLSMHLDAELRAIRQLLMISGLHRS